MKTRGRTSAAALALPSPLETIQRPDAPYDLSDEETEVWWRVVNRLPADWFPAETHDLLTQYCRHVVRARKLAQLVQAEEASEKFSVQDYQRLAKMAALESGEIVKLARQMRISQQASYDKEKKKGAVVSRRPWDPR